MSTLIASTPQASADTPVRVITRSFDDKPTATLAVGREGHTVLVGNRDRTSLLGFPAWDVFRYDDQLFRELDVAFRQGDTLRLKALWEHAEQI